MATSTPLRVLVLLSTGKQGTAVVSQLSASYDPSFQVLAVTRNAQSDAAKRLEALTNVTVIQGSTATPTSTEDLFAKAGPLDGLVIIQLDADEHSGGSEGEIEEANRIIDTAKRHEVKHIVYHGMDLPSTIKHPVQDYVKPKIEIPDYLASESDGGKAYTWTVLRPCNFFENFIGRPGSTQMILADNSPRPCGIHDHPLDPSGKQADAIHQYQRYSLLFHPIPLEPSKISRAKDQSSWRSSRQNQVRGRMESTWITGTLPY